MGSGKKQTNKQTNKYQGNSCKLIELGYFSAPSKQEHVFVATHTVQFGKENIFPSLFCFYF